ncbi:MAG TPA: hypothetical protein V6C84_11255 [Coleofasciculaceae cyanobacterium]|jgi:uncharacterized protein YdeI (BOF family)
MKFNTLFSFAIAAVAASTLPTFASAQAQNLPVQRAALIEVSGEVVNIIGDEFILNTADGQILVDAESRLLRRANLKAGEQITVSGQYDDDNFDGYTLTREDGQTVVIQD